MNPEKLRHHAVMALAAMVVVGSAAGIFAVFHLMGAVSLLWMTLGLALVWLSISLGWKPDMLERPPTDPQLLSTDQCLVQPDWDTYLSSITKPGADTAQWLNFQRSMRSTNPGIVNSSIALMREQSHWEHYSVTTVQYDNCSTVALLSLLEAGTKFARFGHFDEEPATFMVLDIPYQGALDGVPLRGHVLSALLKAGCSIDDADENGQTVFEMIVSKLLKQEFFIQDDCKIVGHIQYFIDTFNPTVSDRVIEKLESLVALLYKDSAEKLGSLVAKLQYGSMDDITPQSMTTQTPSRRL